MEPPAQTSSSSAALAIRLRAGAFYKLQAALLHAALLEEQAARLSERAALRRRSALLEVGLNADGAYQLDEGTLTVSSTPIGRPPAGQ
jgi:hypothetical protein